MGEAPSLDKDAPDEALLAEDGRSSPTSVGRVRKRAQIGAQLARGWESRHRAGGPGPSHAASLTVLARHYTGTGVYGDPGVYGSHLSSLSISFLTRPLASVCRSAVCVAIPSPSQEKIIQNACFFSCS